MPCAFKTLKGGKPSNCSRTIRITSYYVPQTKWGNILVLLSFLLCSPNEVGEHIGFTLFLIIILLLLPSARFLSANVLRNYWSDQHKTFQYDSLAFVDVRNEGHFFRKCMHAHARAFEFLHIITCKTNFFIFRSNSIIFIW
jgi:hypothetical protein